MHKRPSRWSSFIPTEGAYTRKCFRFPPFGAGKFALNDLVEQSNQNSGSLEIEASNGVVAFAIYDDLKIGRQYYAGIVRGSCSIKKF